MTVNWEMSFRVMCVIYDRVTLCPSPFRRLFRTISRSSSSSLQLRHIYNLHSKIDKEPGRDQRLAKDSKMARGTTLNLNQLWVNCSCCHKPYGENEQDSFWLTSCAHILCEKHYKSNMSCCPLCGKHGISLLSLDGDTSQLPLEVQSFFIPFTAQLEPLYTVANFQWDSMAQLCQYYRQMCLKLQEKCNRQRQLLYQAKTELDKYSVLKNDLKTRNGDLLQTASAMSTPTNQLADQESFVTKLQNSHRLKPQRGDSSLSVSNVLAESTSINTKLTPISIPNSASSVSSPPKKLANSTFESRSSSKQTGNKPLPNALERLKLKRSNTSTVSSRGILSHMRMNSSQNMSAHGSSISSRTTNPNSTKGKFKRFR